MPSLERIGKRKVLLSLGLIAGIAITVSLISFYYFSSISNAITSASARETSIKNGMAADMFSKIISNKLESIHDKLAVLANSPAAINGDNEAVRAGLIARQEATKEVTESYFWLDRDGKVVWGTLLLERPEISSFIGADFSDKEYFVYAKDNLQPYSTTVRDSIDGLARIHLSYPIVSPEGEFLGIIAATIRPQGLASFVASQIPLEFDGRIGLLDREGTILYADDNSLVSKNILDQETQILFASTFELEANEKEYAELLAKSMQGQGGSATFSLSDYEISYAYSPVYIGDKLFGSLHANTPQTLDASIAALVQQQKDTGVLMILIAAAAAVGISVITLTWSGRLDALVKERTMQLEDSKKRLEASNEQLAATTEDLRAALIELAENNKKLVAANEQLRRNDSLQQEFIKIAAHELRTPVQPLLGMADILSSQFGEKDDDKQSIEVSKAEIELIVRNAKRLERLSLDILEASKIESNSLRLNAEIFDLNDKIEGAIADMRLYLLQGNQIKIVFKAPTSPLMVEADKVKVFQVISNILKNAIKFMDKGSIIVSAEKSDSGDFAVVSVKDSGTGIDPEIMSKLFTKFATVEGKSYDTRTGSGLGLYIAKSIIGAHGGRIWAENNKDGHGATFHFTLPLIRDSARN